MKKTMRYFNNRPEIVFISLFKDFVEVVYFIATKGFITIFEVNANALDLFDFIVKLIIVTALYLILKHNNKLNKQTQDEIITLKKALYDNALRSRLYQLVLEDLTRNTPVKKGNLKYHLGDTEFRYLYGLTWRDKIDEAEEAGLYKIGISRALNEYKDIFDLLIEEYNQKNKAL